MYNVQWNINRCLDSCKCDSSLLQIILTLSNYNDINCNDSDVWGLWNFLDPFTCVNEILKMKKNTICGIRFKKKKNEKKAI